MSGFDELIDFSYKLASVAFASVWQGTVIALLGIAVLSHIPRVSAAVRGLVWWAILLSALVIPAYVAWPIASRLPDSTLPQIQSVSVIRDRIVLSPDADPGRAVTRETPFDRIRPPAAQALQAPAWLVIAFMMTWAGISAVLLVRVALGVTSVVSIMRRSSPAPDTLHAMMPAPIPVRVTDELSAPAVLGFARPMVLVPLDVAQTLDAFAMRHVLLHELAHVRRRDQWIVLGMRILRSVAFPFPAVHLIARRIEVDQELACDEWALRQSAAKATEYVSSLLRIGELALSPSVHAPAMATQLRYRVESLLRSSATAPSRWWWTRGALVGSGLIGTLIPLSAIVPTFAFVRSSPVVAAVQPATNRTTPPDTQFVPQARQSVSAGVARDTVAILIDQLAAQDPSIRAHAAFALAARRDTAIAAAPALIALLADDASVVRANGRVSGAWSVRESRDSTSVGEEAAKALLYVGRGALADVNAALPGLSGTARTRAEWVAGLLRNFD